MGASLDLVREPVKACGVWGNSGRRGWGLGVCFAIQPLASHEESRRPALLNYSATASQLWRH